MQFTVICVVSVVCLPRADWLSPFPHCALPTGLPFSTSDLHFRLSMLFFVVKDTKSPV